MRRKKDERWLNVVQSWLVFTVLILSLVEIGVQIGMYVERHRLLRPVEFPADMPK